MFCSVFCKQFWPRKVRKWNFSQTIVYDLDYLLLSVVGLQQARYPGEAKLFDLIEKFNQIHNVHDNLSAYSFLSRTHAHTHPVKRINRIKIQHFDVKNRVVHGRRWPFLFTTVHFRAVGPNTYVNELWSNLTYICIEVRDEISLKSNNLFKLVILGKLWNYIWSYVWRCGKQQIKNISMKKILQREFDMMVFKLVICKVFDGLHNKNRSITRSRQIWLDHRTQRSRLIWCL